MFKKKKNIIYSQKKIILCGHFMLYVSFYTFTVVYADAQILCLVLLEKPYQPRHVQLVQNITSYW